MQKQIVDQARVHNLPEAAVKKKVILTKQAIKEFVLVAAIAEMALFLVSENAATLTGAALPLDGGWFAQ